MAAKFIHNWLQERCVPATAERSAGCWVALLDFALNNILTNSQFFVWKKKMSDTIVTSLKLLINRLCSDSTVAKFVAKSRKGPFSWSFITRWCMKKKCWMIFRRLEPQSTSILRVITGSPNCVVCCPFESNQTHFGYTNIMDSKCIDSES